MPKTEADREAEERLELMPRSIRDKLDHVGVKLHLREWQLLSLEERTQLRDLPCGDDDEATHYVEFLERVVIRATGRQPDRLSK